MKQWLKEVARGKRGSKDLSYEETYQLARFMLEGNATDAQIAAYFIAQRMKTESSDELLAFIHAFEEETDKLNTKSSHRLIDFASPYTGRHLFATTIPVSILLAEAGLPVFLHSSDTLPPKYGTSLKDILFHLGINTTQPAPLLTKEIEETNIGFAWTESYCSPLVNLRNIREEIGVRTLLNTVEKLLNISNAKSIMMGAFHRTAINKIAPIFKNMQFENIYIVQGIEGSEDLPVHRNSFIYKITKDKMESFIVKPNEFGLFQEEVKENLSLEQQCEKILAILNGEKESQLDYYYNQILFNAGIRYYLFNVTESIDKGIEMAAEQLKQKRGIKQLEKWRQSQKLTKNLS
jgi:anthranilate phosphoribosyltransferase